MPGPVRPATPCPPVNPPRQQPPAQLPYAPAPPLHRRRSFRRWAAAVAALLILVSVGPLLVRAGWRRGSLLYWQRCCRVGPMRAGFVSSNGKVPLTMVDDAWQQLHTLMLGGDAVATGFTAPNENVLFRQTRARPDGQQRLVVIAVGDYYTGRVPDGRTCVVTLYAHVVAPGGLLREPSESTPSATSAQRALVGLHPGDALLPGTADPKDPTHFTITARRGTTDVAIDGWLKDDDTVVFDPQAVWMD